MIAKDLLEGALDSRQSKRVLYETRAVVTTIPSAPDDRYQSSLPQEVATLDISVSGARIAGSTLLQVGQDALLRTGRDSGLVMSSYGSVVHKARGTAAPSGCEWGIQFNDADTSTLDQHKIFEPFLRETLHENPQLAVIISSNYLELVWWLGQLSERVTQVLVSTRCASLLERLKKATPARDVRSLDGCRALEGVLKVRTKSKGASF
ncbi:MAG: PilZ domain-containing protein [Myxococcales bacterium]|nr:PilZ domain-containing protein [Myxococcales bacterium]